MAQGDSDAGDWKLFVDGRQIREFAGLRGFRKDKNVTYNEGPGGVAFGFNHQRHSNKVSFSINVRDTSPDIEFLEDLVESERPVSIRAKITDSDDLALYGDNQEIEVGCERGVLTGGDRQRGSGEAEDVGFEVLGINAVREYKSGGG